MLWIDHVIWATADLDDASSDFERNFGLRSIAGGDHPEGTTNRVVLLAGPQYIELITVYNRDLVVMDSWGQMLTACIDRGGGLMAWGVGTDDVESFALRNGVSINTGSIERDDGSIGSWCIAEPQDYRNGLPFAIEYVDDAERRERSRQENRTHPVHPSGATAIAWVEVACDQRALEDWLGVHELPIRIEDGPPGLQRVGLKTAQAGNEVVLS